ncbi:MAG: hypothetical protein BWY57_03023 [Betaproteobacteria bacterium ADurb.Bin341]|nr:MAG: hypothetical protein BWY57_03023 [Betaproteobacteria bacterium ADurb.Bin341]
MTTRINTTFRTSALDHLNGATATLAIYTGSQPASADDAASGTLLVTISDVYFGTVTNGAIALDSGMGPYQANAVATGTAGWGRLTISDGSVVDGSVATSGAQFNISSTSIASGDTVIFNSCTLSMPGG